MQVFKQSYQILFPQSRSFLQTVLQHPKIFVHHPLRLLFNKQKDSYQIRSAAKIPPRSTIMMISATQCFTNAELAGATRKEYEKTNEILNKMKKDYEIFNAKQREDLMKFFIQIYANSLELDEPMPLYHFAKELTKMRPSKNPLHYLEYINSLHFLNIMKAKEQVYKNVYQIVSENFFQLSEEQQFKKLIDIIRRSMLSAGQSSIIAPFLPYANFSLSPTAKIVGKYMFHLKSSYFCVESCKQIEEGEEITLSYPNKYTNYELIERYGRVEKDNPYHEYILLANMSIPQVLATGNVDKKMTLLKKNKLAIKNMVKINNLGEINKNDMKLLRILFSSSDEPSEQQTENDTKIKNFVKMAIEEQLQRESKAAKATQGSSLMVQNIRELEQSDRNILNKFLSRS